MMGITKIEKFLSLTKLFYYESFINGNNIKSIVMLWNHIILMLYNTFAK
jgi:hypothetical protein